MAGLSNGAHFDVVVLLDVMIHMAGMKSALWQRIGRDQVRMLSAGLGGKNLRQLQLR